MVCATAEVTGDMLVDPETYQQHIFEVVGLHAIFGDDVRVWEGRRGGTAPGEAGGTGSTSGHRGGDSVGDTNGVGGGAGGSSGSSRGERDGGTGRRDSDHGEELDVDSLMCAEPPSAPVPPLTCEVAVRVDVPPPGVQVYVDLASDGSGGDSGGKAGVGLTAFGSPVSHLPPLRVCFALPADYPSSRPPAVQLQCVWLASHQLQELTQQLQQQWAGQGPGEPICFLWLDWLRCSALQHLAGLAGHRRDAGGTAPATAVATAAAVAHLLLRYSGTGESDHALAGDADALAALASAPRPTCSAGGTQSEASTSDGGTGDGRASRLNSTSRRSAYSAQELALSTLRYSARCELEAFQSCHHRCIICYDDCPGTRFLWLPECRHHEPCCHDCLAQHCRTQLAGGAVDKMQCPHPECRRVLPPPVLEQLLSQDEMARWDGLLLQRTLDRMDDVVYCPRVSCRAVCIEDADHCTQCPKCLFVFCSLCTDSWHPGLQCVDPESRLELLQQRRARAGGQTSRADSERQHQQALDMINQMKSLKLVHETSRPCPSCDMAITKTEGCNKMVCSYCSAKFCWQCREVIEGYEHFGAGRCEMLDLEEVARWNRLQGGPARPPAGVGGVRARLEEGRDMFQLIGRQGRPVFCPQCGQVNLKEGNNNGMRCWACTSAFCYKCRTVLRGRPGTHFTPSSACKQHSYD